MGFPFIVDARSPDFICIGKSNGKYIRKAGNRRQIYFRVKEKPKHDLPIYKNNISSSMLKARRRIDAFVWTPITSRQCWVAVCWTIAVGCLPVKALSSPMMELSLELWRDVGHIRDREDSLTTQRPNAFPVRLNGKCFNVNVTPHHVNAFCGWPVSVNIV